VSIRIGGRGRLTRIVDMSTVTTFASPLVSELAVAAAWQRYLSDTYGVPAYSYEAVEEEAWCILERRLVLIGRPLDRP
jgi:hypothetical protein